MTMTMLEKVARAICEAQGDEWGREGPVGLMDAYGPFARAALQALREPTEEMVEAMSATPTYGYPLPAEAVPDHDFLEDHRIAFMAAIDAILQKKG